jgi:hypothetical protein
MNMAQIGILDTSINLHEAGKQRQTATTETPTTIRITPQILVFITRLKSSVLSLLYGHTLKTIFMRQVVPQMPQQPARPGHPCTQWPLQRV